MEKIEIIKYEGDNSTFVWKHPCEDFDSTTQLIVHESQEAIFFMNGQALDLFGPGRYTLETQNVPFVGKALNRATDGKSPFHCEVYFINQTVQMGLKWGTDSKVRFIDSLTGVPLELGACGEMNLQVADSRKLLVKLVGTMRGIAWGEGGEGFTKSLQSAFRPLISTAVKTNLATVIQNESIDILEIDTHLEQLSASLRQRILPGFEEYGLTIPQFYLTTVLLPENDPNFRKIRELHTISFQTRLAQAEATVKTAQAESEAVVTAARRQIELERQTTETEVTKREAERKVITAEAEAQAARMAGLTEAEIMRAKGYTQKDVIQADVQKAFAEGIGNMGSGDGSGSGMMSNVMGLGVGLAAAGAMGGPVSDLLKGFAGAGTPQGTGGVCPKCGKALPVNAKFCMECGIRIEQLAEGEMLCPVCGKKTPKGKFCMECGAPLIRKCPNCGAEVPNGGKFCLECGTRMEG